MGSFKLLFTAIFLFILLPSSAFTTEESKAPKRKSEWPSEKFIKRCYEKIEKEWDSLVLKRDISYLRNDNPAQSLDLLIPKKRKSENLPIIVFIHGGGWQSGHKATMLPTLASYAASGDYVVASINYRLSGEAIWPAQIHDCQAAIRWIKGNAENLQIDTERIGIWGTSAGGHLVSMVGTSWENTDIDGKLGDYSDLSTKVNCVINSFGPIDFNISYETANEVWKERFRNANGPEAQLIGGSLVKEQELISSANPVTYLDKNDPDFFVIHGDADNLVNYKHSEYFHKELKSVGVNSTFLTVHDGGHGKGFGYVGVHIKAFFDHHLLDIKREWKDFSVEKK